MNSEILNVDKRLESLLTAFQDYSTSVIDKNVLTTKIADIFRGIFEESTERKVSVSAEFVKNEKEKPFFFRISPSARSCDSILWELYNEKVSYENLINNWHNSKNVEWIIEIDSTIFNNQLSLNPYEMAALCFHTIIYTVFSNEVIDRFYRMYKEVTSQFTYTDSKKFRFVSALFIIPLYISSTLKSWSASSDGLAEENNVDLLTQQAGYDRHLISALNKVIKTYGNSNFLTETEKDNIVKTEMLWACVNIKDIANRKHSMKAKYIAGTAITNSNSRKEIYLYVANRIGLKQRREEYIDYENITLESLTSLLDEKGHLAKGYELMVDSKALSAQESAIRSIDRNKDIVLESFFKKNKKKLIPDQYDIDEIAVEIDRIENHHDRLFVLDLIYAQFEKISAFEEALETDKSLKRYEAQANSMKKQLNELREIVLSKKKLDTQYKLFVKVPAGYEG